MNINIFIFLIYGSFLIVSTNANNDTDQTYTLCIPKHFYEELHETYIEYALIKKDSPIQLVTGNDIIDCMNKVEAGTYDSMMAFDIITLWIAAHTPKYHNLQVFLEYVNRRNKDANRHEVVAVIPKDLDINSIHDLKGLNACFQELSSDEGFNAPYMKLRGMDILKEKYNPAISAKENKLKELSSFFANACIPSQWSQVSKIDDDLKQKYSNLHALCKNETDTKNLNCLTENAGSIAWAIRDEVVNYFKVLNRHAKTIYTEIENKIDDTENSNDDTDEKVDNTRKNIEQIDNKEDTEKYVYLCPDGTKQPLDNIDSCTWSRKPFNIFLTNPAHIKSISDLKRKLHDISEKMFEDLHIDKLVTVDSTNTVSPSNIIKRLNYSDMVMEDEIDGYKLRTINYCVKSDLEMAKCQTFSNVALLINIRPSFNCVLKQNVDECFKYIKDNGGVTYIDPYYIDIAKTKYNLVPIMAELQETNYVDVVAVVKSDSEIENWEHLRGSRSCHPNIQSSAGYIAPTEALIEAGIISNETCPSPKVVSEFFSGGSCLPGLLKMENNSNETDSNIFCPECRTTCSPETTDMYDGDVGALNCLMKNKGDVAFLRYNYIENLLDVSEYPLSEKNSAVQLDTPKLKILCPNGNLITLDKSSECAILKEPPFMIVAKADEPQLILNEIQDALADASEYFETHNNHIYMYKTYGGKTNLLFQTPLTSPNNYETTIQIFSEKIQEARTC